MIVRLIVAEIGGLVCLPTVLTMSATMFSSGYLAAAFASASSATAAGGADYEKY